MEYFSVFRNTEAESWPVGEKPGTIAQPDSENWALPYHTVPDKHRRTRMLRWALGFFIVALVAALLGFTGISIAAAGIAKILFYLFLILFLVTLMGHLLRRS
jgi:uncharacterized membrane protein YtjA (UPF0391 family)